jgi:hypothetical protein
MERNYSPIYRPGSPIYHPSSPTLEDMLSRVGEDYDEPRTHTDKKAKRDDEFSLPSESDESRDSETNDSVSQCIVCYTNRKTCVFRPCNHMSTCIACTRTMCKETSGRSCPVCRAKIESILTIYQ